MVVVGAGRQPGRARAGRITAIVGAAGAQFSQAAGSFVVAVLSMRQPDVQVFTTLSLLLGALVVATSVSTGLVGDPLTVLDRHDPATRTALRRLLGAVVVLTSGLATSATVAAGLVSLRDGLLFGGLVVAWVVEDVLRRLLMACLHFWRVVAVDLVHLATVIGVLEAVAVRTERSPGLGWFLVALSCGQVAAAVVAVGGLPRTERYLGRAVPGRFGVVLRFGGNRAVQGLLRPGVLLLIRVVVVATSGSQALARLETGRIVTAPALLLVSGGGAYLLGRYAQRMRDGDVGSRRDADRAALLLGLVTVGSICAVLGAVLAFPGALGGTGTGGTGTGGTGWRDLVPLIGVWGGYGLSVAVAMPYASLGAVRLPQARLLRARLLDAGLQVAAGAALLAVAPGRWLLLPLLTGAVSMAVTSTALRPLLAGPSPHDHRPHDHPVSNSHIPGDLS